MKVDGYLRKLQKIQWDTRFILDIEINTTKYFDDGTDAIHIRLCEYDHRNVQRKTGDYEMKNLAIYSFFSKEENDNVLKEITDYVNTQMAKHHG